MKFSARDTIQLRKKRAGVWGCCRVYEGGGKGIYGGGYFDFRHRGIGDIEQQRKEPATQNFSPGAAVGSLRVSAWWFGLLVVWGRDRLRGSNGEEAEGPNRRERGLSHWRRGEAGGIAA